MASTGRDWPPNTPPAFGCGDCVLVLGDPGIRDNLRIAGQVGSLVTPLLLQSFPTRGGTTSYS